MLRRRDASGNWSTLDDMPLAATAVGTPPLETAHGRLIYLLNGADSAITRMSSDDGASWQTIDTYAYAGDSPTTAYAIAADPEGNLFSVYGGNDADDVTHWLVRKMPCE